MNWKAFVVIFLLVWAAVVSTFGHWPSVTGHWQTAAIMAPASLVAGSTPMGGGTIAFPILVWSWGRSAANARNFGFLIQAAGMTSAMIFALGRKVRLPWRLLTGSACGAALGFIFGTYVLASYFSQPMVKLLFSCLWMSFGLLMLARTSEICAFDAEAPRDGIEQSVGFAAGVIGGSIAAMIGVGVEMTVFTAMVLLFRADLKIAIPTAVSAGALASIEGTVLHLWLGDLDAETVYDWLAAAPVVIFGAPIGIWLTRVLPRMKTLSFVAAICVFQFAWALRQTAHNRAEWTFVMAIMLAALGSLGLLYRLGRKALDA